MSQVIRLSAGGVIPPGTYVQTLTGDSGGAVGPDGADNINIIANNATVNAGSTVLLVGTPINNTLTLNVSDISSNTLLGRNAGNLTTSGSSNTGVGTGVLSAITSGSGNTAVGVDALNLATTGSANVAIGFEAGINVTGLNNTIVGYAALSTASAANSNTVIGYQAMANSTAGANNIVLGVSAASAFTGSEGNNIIIGNTGTLADTNTIRIGTQGAGVGQQNRNFQAGINGVTVASPRPVVIDSVTNQLGVDSGTGSVLTLTGDVGPAVSPTANNINVVSGRLTNNAGGSVYFEADLPSTLVFNVTNPVTQNTFVGRGAGDDLATGLRNTSFGNNALAGITTGSDNIAIGSGSLPVLSNGTSNIGIGTSAGLVLSSGQFNVLIGNSNGAAITTSNANVAVGYNAMASGNTANNTFVGFGAGFSSGSIGSNTAVGYQALGNAPSGSNVAIGVNCMFNTPNAAQNVMVGASAAQTLTGTANVGIGINAMQNATDTNFNVAVGPNTLTALGFTSAWNVAIGSNALQNLSFGNGNIAIGLNAGTALVAGETSCIYLNSTGVGGENYTLRIGDGTGTSGTQLNRAFIHGINGNTVSNAQLVTINSSTSQLGVTPLSPSSLFPWSEITTSQTAAVNNGYFINSVGSMNLALPATSAVGDVIEVCVVSNGSTLVITQAAGQQIFYGTANTTLGAAGTLTSSAIGDSLKLVCRTANTIWYVVSSIGTWTEA